MTEDPEDHHISQIGCKDEGRTRNRGCFFVVVVITLVVIGTTILDLILTR